MAVPASWLLAYSYNVHGVFEAVIDARGICPHCRISTTFTVRAMQRDAATGSSNTLYLILRCNHAPCRKTVYVETTTANRQMPPQSTPHDDFYLYPSGDIDPAHVSIPADIADDWLEAQRSFNGDNPKAAAVMLRRVLYGVLIDKGCKLRPLHEGVRDLIAGQRLPAVFDDWLPAITDDGHDGAHPDRALKVSTENVAETMEYTAELLRYLYVEPYEFQQRKARNAPPLPPTT